MIYFYCVDVFSGLWRPCFQQGCYIKVEEILFFHLETLYANTATTEVIFFFSPALRHLPQRWLISNINSTKLKKCAWRTSYIIFKMKQKERGEKNTCSRSRSEMSESSVCAACSFISGQLTSPQGAF